MENENINYTAIPNALGSMSFWRFVAAGILPNEQNKERMNELATLLRLQAQHISDNWDQMNEIATKAGSFAVSWNWSSDRSQTPAIAKVGGTYSEVYKMKGESEVPNPDQVELPFERENNENRN